MNIIRSLKSEKWSKSQRSVKWLQRKPGIFFQLCTSYSVSVVSSTWSPAIANCCAYILSLHRPTFYADFFVSEKLPRPTVLRSLISHHTVYHATTHNLTLSNVSVKTGLASVYHTHVSHWSQYLVLTMMKGICISQATCNERISN